MSRLRWPDSTNSVSDDPGTVHSGRFSLHQRRCSTVLSQERYGSPSIIGLYEWTNAYGMRTENGRAAAVSNSSHHSYGMVLDRPARAAPGATAGFGAVSVPN